MYVLFLFRIICYSSLLLLVSSPFYSISILNSLLILITFWHVLCLPLLCVWVVYQTWPNSIYVHFSTPRFTDFQIPYFSAIFSSMIKFTIWAFDSDACSILIAWITTFCKQKCIKKGNLLYIMMLRMLSISLSPTTNGFGDFKETLKKLFFFVYNRLIFKERRKG